MTIKGYFTLFVVALILVLCCAVLWLWRDKDDAKAALLAAQNVHVTDVAVHVEDQKTIKQITTYNDQNERVIAKYIAVVSGIDGAFGKLNDAISNLRRQNAEVEDYLSKPIPRALLCVLDPGNSVCVIPKAAPATAAP